MTGPTAPGDAAPISPPSAVEAARLARNLARNLGWPVFPCAWETKRPTRPKAEGGRGFHDATTDPEQIAKLWRRWPGALIGVPTGPASGFSVLDVDTKHDAARAWWIANEPRLPTTRTFRTRGGGLHLWFQHADGVRNVEGKPVQGIDARGEGGYIIYWFAAGCECIDPSAPAAWPHWLTPFFWPPPAPRLVQAARKTAPADLPDLLERVRQRAIEMVRRAAEGQRHNRLRDAGLLLGGIQARGGFPDADAIRWLLDELPPDADLEKSRDTAAWALDAGRHKPLDMGGRP